MSKTVARGTITDVLQFARRSVSPARSSPTRAPRTSGSRGAPRRPSGRCAAGRRRSGPGRSRWRRSSSGKSASRTSASAGQPRLRDRVVLELEIGRKLRQRGPVGARSRAHRAPTLRSTSASAHPVHPEHPRAPPRLDESSRAVYPVVALRPGGFGERDAELEVAFGERERSISKRSPRAPVAPSQPSSVEVARAQPDEPPPESRNSSDSLRRGHRCSVQLQEDRPAAPPTGTGRSALRAPSRTPTIRISPLPHSRRPAPTRRAPPRPPAARGSAGSPRGLAVVLDAPGQQHRALAQPLDGGRVVRDEHDVPPRAELRISRCTCAGRPRRRRRTPRRGAGCRPRCASRSRSRVACTSRTSTSGPAGR